METEVKTTKVCTKCGVEKTFDLFAKSKLCKDGMKNICKICHNERNKQWAQNNREKVSAYHKQWQKNNPEKVNEKSKRWQKNNREKVRERDKKWRKNNPEKVREKYKQWAQNNPEKKRQNNRKYVKKSTLNVSEVYVKKVLLKKGFRKEDITDDLINVQQLIIKTKRLCKTSHN